MKQYARRDRVGRLILEILAELLTRGVQDPRVEGATLTSVELGDDLRMATVRYHALGPSSKEDVQAGLDSARGLLRRELGRRIEMKFTPDLRFAYDSGLDHQQRIEEILRGLRREGS